MTAATPDTSTHVDSSPGGRRRRVAILYQLPESWGNVRSVWDAMQRDDGIEPSVIMVPFLHPDYRWNREDAARHLDELGLPWRAWDEIDLRTAGLDAALFTSPYDETRPPAWRFPELRRHVPFTGYVPYGLEVGGGDINLTHQYGQPVAMHGSAVFVRSQSARGMYSRHCPTGDRHVVVSGHPRMDGLVDLDRFPVDPELRAQIGDRRAVLWNAHFSFDGDLWSSFDQLAMPIFRAFARRPELVLLFRPHPLLWKKLLNLSIFDEAGVAAFREELLRMGVVIDERPDHRHAFAASSAMLTDAGSFLMEYFVTGKPVLYLRNPHGLGLNDEGAAVARYYDTATSDTDIARFLDSLGHRPETEKAQRMAAIPMFFADFDGNAGQRVVDHIKYALGA
ncbi:CDP-glycerol glycerophosphotransferase family protein [Xanthomonas sp. XNM01]|uniref:CDP-glycerol glycerophosphotransferase family protein n=1 Tax=Xanthomonas sp. XNM01 TaxID=2769289 RepID=UPI00177E382F|nr:CDP-glycerol glycerophosphotransferase family protein [Xanthomonas sp. XNM01]MBD9367900.1 CDP-glycerol glycerophosphotransferase family protein [Xanthomonas sp. XNM01]